MQMMFSNTKISGNIHHCRIEGSFGREPSLISWVVFQGCLVQNKIQQLERLLQLHVLSMAAVVHIIKPQWASVFGEHTEMQLLPYLESHMMNRTARLDAIRDTDKERSLKYQIWIKRGGTTSRITRVPNKILIRKWAQW